jgi:hypothetical protein
MVCHDLPRGVLVEIMPFTNFVKDHVSSKEVPGTSTVRQDLTA